MLWVHVGTVAVHSMLDDPDSLCTVRECRDLEAIYDTNFTSAILCNTDKVLFVHDIKKEVMTHKL